MLAIWKAGAVYLPLDLSAPSGRLALILADACPAILIATAGTAGRIAAAAGSASAQPPSAQPPSAQPPSAPAAEPAIVLVADRAADARTADAAPPPTGPMPPVSRPRRQNRAPT